MSFADDPQKVHLADLQFRVKERFLYEYDFGDGWQHEVRVERKLALGPKRLYPVCIGGRRACPPEDCGGAWGFMSWEQRYSIFDIAERLEQVLISPESDAELDREEVNEWVCWLEKERFDRCAVNQRLRQYARGDEEWRLALG